MGLLCVGLDESTDQLQRNVFVVAGYLATQPDWCEIEHQWMQRLERQPSPISYFKTSEWKYLPGQFRQFRDQAAYPKPKGREAADAIKSDLEQIMRTSPVRGFGFGINLKDYRAVRRSSRARRIFGPNPYENAYLMTFIRVVGTCQEEMPSRVNSEIVAFLCDESNRSSNVKAVYDKLKEHNPRCGPWLGSLTYMDNEKSPALQAADLLAWNCREFITECLKDNPQAFPPKPNVVAKWKAILGKNVGVGCINKKCLNDVVNANIPRDGRFSIYSSGNLCLFSDLTFPEKKGEFSTKRI